MNGQECEQFQHRRRCHTIIAKSYNLISLKPILVVIRLKLLVKKHSVPHIKREVSITENSAFAGMFRNSDST